MALEDCRWMLHSAVFDAPLEFADIETFLVLPGTLLPDLFFSQQGEPVFTSRRVESAGRCAKRVILADCVRWAPIEMLAEALAS